MKVSVTVDESVPGIEETIRKCLADVGVTGVNVEASLPGGRFYSVSIGEGGDATSIRTVLAALRQTKGIKVAIPEPDAEV